MSVLVLRDGPFICFFDGVMCFYDLSLEQINKNGVDYWLNDEVKNQFLQLI